MKVDELADDTEGSKKPEHPKRIDSRRYFLHFLILLP